jgi:hypothetical protein
LTEKPVVSTVEALAEPTSTFISDLTVAIRAGAKPVTAAEWLGVSRKTYRSWLRRPGEPYETLRRQVRSALAHLEVRLAADVAKKHPDKALRALRAADHPDAVPDTPSDGRTRRPYTRSGVHVVTKALPHLVERVADASIANEALTPVERAAREWRQDVIADHGGISVLTAARCALLDAAVGTFIVLHSLDAFLFELANARGLASRKHRRAFPIVADRMRVADSLARQLQTLGLDRQPPKVQSLDEYLSSARVTTSEETH